MVLADLLGVEAYRERVKIYATDIDDDALGQARLATYTAKEIESVPAELRERYFERADQRFAFRKDLRRTVIFGRNNLVQDAPISRLDLLICRNTLMYFNAETQAPHPASLPLRARPGGRADARQVRDDDLASRSVRPVGPQDADLPQAAACVDGLSGECLRAGEVAATGRQRPRGPRRLVRDRAAGPGHRLAHGRLAFANLPARALFQISREDIGRPFSELPLAHRPVDLLAPVERALRERRRVALGESSFAPERGDARQLDVTVAPLLSGDNVAIGAGITFEDVTRYAALQTELEGNRRDLELAYEELQSTIDELETTNEELQSANEELQTTNEELQSTNEELETMNEELQSTNEELETINDELRERTSELNQVNEFLEAILTSIGLGVAVLDPQQRVQIWNRRAEDLWGMRADEAIDHHFLSLDIGLPSEQLAPALRAVLSGASEREQAELEAINRRGRPIVCTATVLRLQSPGATDGKGVRGAIVMMEDRPPADSGA